MGLRGFLKNKKDDKLVDSSKAVKQPGHRKKINNSSKSKKNQLKPGGGYGHYAQPKLNQLQGNADVIEAALNGVLIRSQQLQSSKKAYDTKAVDRDKRTKSNIRKNNQNNNQIVESIQQQFTANDKHHHNDLNQKICNNSKIEQKGQQQPLNNVVDYLQGLIWLAEKFQAYQTGEAVNAAFTIMKDKHKKSSFISRECDGYNSDLGNQFQTCLALLLRIFVCLIVFCSSPLIGIMVLISCFWAEACAGMILNLLTTDSRTSRNSSNSSN